MPPRPPNSPYLKGITPNPSLNGVHTPHPAQEWKGIKPFVFLGMDLARASVGEHIGECPFCDSGKFHVNSLTGQWECKRCNESGNAITFMRTIYTKSYQAYGDEGLEELAKERRLLDPKTLTKWGVCKSCLSGEWIVPGYNAEKKIAQVYIYKMNHDIGKRVWWGTPKVSEHDESMQGLFGGHLFDKTKSETCLLEGIGDAMCAWEINGGRVNILGTPGAMILFESWIPTYFTGQRVSILFDSDHPKTNKQTGDDEEPRGFVGTKRIAGILKGASTANRPESIKYLRWGPNGYDPTLKSGWDVRDALTLSQKGELENEIPRKERDRRLRELLGKIEPVPDEWPAVKMGSEEITPLKCESWAELVKAWKSAMFWSSQLERVLVVMLSSVISTDIVGDPIWVRVIGAAGCGKTTLAKGIIVSKKYALEVSHLTGFHSGYRTDKDGEEDHSLITKMQRKTVVFKEGDTLLKSPVREKILSEMRDIYDGSSNAHYKHGVPRNYPDIISTFIMLGTTNMLELDAAECGARFIDCVVSPKNEREACKFNARRALRNMNRRRGGRQENHGDAEEIMARRMTGGYVEHIRHNNRDLTDPVMGSMTDEQEDKLINYGMFVAHMRGRPSKTQSEVSEREFGTRLSAQYVRLAVCVAAVTGRTTIDKYVMEIVRGVALDTSRGKCIDIVEYMYPTGQEGKDFKTMYKQFGGKEDDFRAMVRYMSSPGVNTLEQYEARDNEFMTAKPKYRLSKEFRELYDLVKKGVSV